MGGQKLKKLNQILIFTLIFTIILSTTSFAAAPPPELIGTSAITIDMDTGEIIYTKDIDAKVYPASITKLLTAILLADNMQKNETLTYTENAKAQPAYSYGKNIQRVELGDTMKADDVMDALLLFSGNDIAYMIADNVGGNPDNFAKMMNKKAAEIGMKNSNFVTPNGLDENTNDHYTTAHDLTKLAKAAYENQWINESMSKNKSEVRTANTIPSIVENRNKLLGVDGCIGGKTGYTEKAGRCLVAIYERDGRHLVGVVMNSEWDLPNDTKVFEDMQNLINWSYEAEKDIFIKKNSTVETVSVPYKVIPFIGPEKTAEIPLIIKDDVMFYNNDIKPEKAAKADSINVWKLDTSEAIGTLTVSQRDVSKSYKVYSSVSTKDILKDNLLIYIGIGAALLIIIILLIILIAKIRNGKRRHRRYYY
jgi:D-alanyl-D-alanine carboxypeptidase